MMPTTPQTATLEQLQALLGQRLQGSQTFDPQAFVDDNRLHIEHGAFFFPDDPLLMIHPRELHPQNDAALREKIRAIYRSEYPPYFNDSNRAVIGAALGNFIPLSQTTKNIMLSHTLERWMEELQKGEDANFTKMRYSEQQPFAAVIQGNLADETLTPDIEEFSKNAIMLTLMMEEAMRRQGHLKPLSEYVKDSVSPDALVAKLAEHLGINPRTFAETAATQGVDGVGRLLKLDDDFMKEIWQLSQALPKHHFSYNTVANWEIGRMLPGMESAGVHEKIDAGMETRLSMRIEPLRKQLNGRFEVAKNIKQTEHLLVGALRLLPPPIAEALFLLGTEIAYTPENDLDSLDPEVNAYGYHRKVVKNPDDVEGIYQIYLSRKGDEEAFARVLFHEACHLLFPGKFSLQEIQQVDALANEDKMRLEALNELMDQWRTGDARQKAQVITTLNRPEFAIGGRSFNQMLGNASMETFHNHVRYAYQRLQKDSPDYRKSSYTTPESRFQEINSRYSEMRYVRLQEFPEMLKFISPGITEIHETIYLPHVEETLKDLRIRAAEKASAPQAKAPSVATTHPGTIPDSVASSIYAPQNASSGRVAASLEVANKPMTSIFASSAVHQQPSLYQSSEAKLQ